MTEVNVIAAFHRKGRFIAVSRDNHGHWFVENNGICTQKRLNAKEIVCYLAHVAEDNSERIENRG